MFSESKNNFLMLVYFLRNQIIYHEDFTMLHASSQCLKLGTKSWDQNWGPRLGTKTGDEHWGPRLGMVLRSCWCVGVFMTHPVTVALPPGD